MQGNIDKIKSIIKLFRIAKGGKGDIAYNNCQLMLAEFDKMNVKYIYIKYLGCNTWPVWSNNLYNLAQLSFR